MEHRTETSIVVTLTQTEAESLGVLLHSVLKSEEYSGMYHGTRDFVGSLATLLWHNR